jgi:hypothetical protein
MITLPRVQTTNVIEQSKARVAMLFRPCIRLVLIMAAAAVAAKVIVLLLPTLTLNLVPLVEVPGISEEVLIAQNKSVRIDDPVTFLPKEKAYFFNVTILDRTNFAETSDGDYELVGDAKLLLGFVREVRFVNNDHGSLAGAVGRGAKDDLEAIFNGLVNVIRHPIDTGVGLGHGSIEFVDYLTKCATGENDFVRDFHDFLSKYAENVYCEEATIWGLNYRQLFTPDAQSIIQSRGRAKISGMAATEIVLLALPWLKASKAIEAAEVTRDASLASEANAVGRAKEWARFFPAAGAAEDGAVAIARSTEIANRMTNLERLANLVSPAKVVTLKGSRVLNSRLHKVLYWLHEEELAGHDVAEALTRAMKIAGADIKQPLVALDRAQILQNYERAKQLSVFESEENLAMLRRGRAPRIDTPWGSDFVEVDHEIAVSWAPELDNSWANLSYQTKRYNRLRGDRLSEQSMDKLLQYKRAGRLPQERIDQIVLRASKAVAVQPADSGL